MAVASPWRAICTIENGLAVALPRKTLVQGQSLLPSDSAIPFRNPTGLASAAYSAAASAKLPTVVIVYLITVVMPVQFNLGSIALTPLRVMLLFLLIPLTSRLFSGQYGKVLVVDYLFFAHMAWATLAVAINNPNRVVENIGSNAVEFLGGYLIGRAYIRTPDQFQQLIKTLIIMVIILLPFTFPESLRGKAVIPQFISALPGLESVKQVDIPKRMGLYRAQNVFAHPIHYGLFCSITFSLMLVGLQDKLSLGKRILCCIVVLISVFLSLSSGALLAVILQVFLLVWAYIFRAHKHKWLLLVGMIGLAYVTVDILSNRTPMKVFMSYATFSSQTAYYRSIIFDYGMQNVWANPVFGLGLRTWFRPAYMKTGSVDNYWLVMAMKYGIPGFTLVTIGYFWGLFKIGLRNLDFSPRVWRLRLAWVITFCGLSFTMTTVHIWTAVYSFVFFFYASAIWMIYYSPEDEGATAPSDTASGQTRGQFSYSRDHAKVPPSRPIEGPVYSRGTPVAEASAPTLPASRGEQPQYSRFSGPKGGPESSPRQRDKKN